MQLASLMIMQRQFSMVRSAIFPSESLILTQLLVLPLLPSPWDHIRFQCCHFVQPPRIFSALLAHIGDHSEVSIVLANMWSLLSFFLGVLS
jgi:hypothetical protein